MSPTRVVTHLFVWALLLPALALAAAGNLNVVQADAVTSNTTCSILEIDKATPGLVHATHVVPGAGPGAIRVSGSATSTLYASNSADGTLFAFTGANSTNTAANANTLNPRAVVALDASGSIALPATYTGASGNQTRCATTLNGTTWFIADQGGVYTNGSVTASPSGNFRGMKAFGSTVYASAASSTVIQVGTVSSASGGVYTGLPGLAANASHQDFWLIQSGASGATFDVLYTTSATSNTAGTIAKYSLVGGTWTANGTFASSFGGFGIAAEATAGGAILYVTTGQGALANNQVLRLTDAAGYNAALSLTNDGALFTATGGKVVKGLAFSPISSGPAAPVQLAITSVNGGSSPSVGDGFTVVVQARDATSAPANVLVNTDVALSLNSGTGVLGGTLTGTILAGQNSASLTGVTYDAAESGVVITATRTAGDPLSPGSSAPFTVLEPADHLAFTVVPAAGTHDVPLPAVSVAARRSNGTLVTSWSGTVTIANASGPGSLSGTTSVAAVGGVATFSNLVENAGGVYTLSASSPGLAGATSSAVRVSGLEEVLLPKFIQGDTGGTNTDRVPFAYRVTLTFLQPNATYRYFNQAVMPTEAPGVSGAGNCIFPNPGGFVRTTGPSLSSAGNHGEFTTDAAGSYTGWFVTEPSGNARFAPGNTLLMRIMLNDGAGGTSVAQRTSTTSVVFTRQFGGAASQGSAIRGESSAAPRSFVMLHEDPSGAGRPVAGTLVESDGTANTVANSYADFYADDVNALAGRWGAFIPNDLATGIRRIENRSLATGAIEGCPAIDDDGVWPSGADTSNAGSGFAPIVITATDAPFTSVPLASCAGLTLALDAAGTATLSASQVDAGSSDACGIASMSVMPSTFTCADLGPRPVTLTVVNVLGISATCTTTVTVVDGLAPSIAGVGADASVECPAAPAFSSPIATDNCGATLSHVDATVAGCGASRTITRTWTGVDASGNSTSESQTVEVVDATAPAMTPAPADAVVELGAVPAPATIVATDACEGAVPVTFTETVAAGACPVLRVLTRTWTAVDGCGHVATEQQVITVRDTTAPVIVAGTTGNGCLWPPNHRLVTRDLASFGATATDAAGPATLRIVSCLSSEADDGRGDGSTAGDCVVAPGGDAVALRAERSGGGEGRTYTIEAVATDACGNASAPAVIGRIVVPHSLRDCR